MIEQQTEETVSLPVYRAQPEQSDYVHPDPDVVAVPMSSSTPSAIPDYILSPPPAYAPAKPLASILSRNQ
jgi:hypothetical protein